MSKPNQKPQFNMREFLESTAYTELNTTLQTEINSFKIEQSKELRSSKAEIKKAKKSYNLLKSEPEAFKASQKEMMEVIVLNLKKQPKFNFTIK